MVATILFGAMFMTQRKHYRIFGHRRTPYNSYLDTAGSDRSSDELLDCDLEDEYDAQDPTAAAQHLPKQRKCCGMLVQTPNTSRFKDTLQSRVLKRFPFLIEMFYWIINYAFYRMTSITSQRIFAATGIWAVAESHGIAVLDIEQNSWLRTLFPIHEWDVQQWFMHGHRDALTALNKVYALIHIPGTVG